MYIDYKTVLLQVLLLVVRRRSDVLSLSSDHIRKGATAISESASLWANSCGRILFVPGIPARWPTNGDHYLCATLGR